MGLDFSHARAHWSYSGFNDFRERLAKHVNFNLNDMDGFGGTRDWSGIDDALVPLLNHSDCDGHLTPRQCRKVFPRVLEIVMDWDLDDDDRADAIEMAAGMALAYAQGQNFEFW